MWVDQEITVTREEQKISGKRTFKAGSLRKVRFGKKILKGNTITHEHNSVVEGKEMGMK